MGDKTVTHLGSLREIPYEEIREAMGDEPFTMELSLSDGAAVQRAVNVGIDAHLEACYTPSTGDSYTWGGGKLSCVVSKESLPVLLRRLAEMAIETGEEPCDLSDSLLSSLGFNENGIFVGREALGLE